MNAGTIAVKKFDPVTGMPEHTTILVVAKRRSGKSVLVRDLLRRLRSRYYAAMVMSGTEISNHFYSDFVPKTFIYYHLDEAALERLIQNQRRMINKGQPKNVVVVLDDLGFDKKSFNRPVLRNLMMNGRHWRITLIMCLQYMLDISPSVRSQVDVFITLKENFFREKLYKTFFNFLPNLGTFNQIMDHCTENYGALILNNSSNSNDLQDILFWYRAQLPCKPFRLGDALFWKFDEKIGKDEDDEVRPSSSRARKVGSSTVKLLK